MPNGLLNVVLFFGLLALVAAVEIQRVNQQSSSSVAVHATTLARALKSKRTRTKASTVTGLASLRGIATSEAASLTQTDDDDKDDDDDGKDDDKDDDDGKDDESEASEASGPKSLSESGKVSEETAAASTALFKGAQENSAKAAQDAAAEQKKKSEEAAAAEQKKQEAAAAEKARKAAEAAEKEHKEAVEALEAAKDKRAKVKSEIKHMSDDTAFESKIEDETKQITNETQSPVLANFLGEFRTEMRNYAMPAYPKYLQGRLDAADKKVEELEDELDAKEAALKAAGGKAAKEKKEESKEAKLKPKEKVTTQAVRKVDTDSEDLAKDVAQKAGETWAISFFANVAMLAVIFAMASTKNQEVSNYTWFLIDQVVAIFLAVMYFNAFDALLDFHSMGVSSEAVASVCHAIAMLLIVLGAAIALRKNEVSLAILCGAGAHIVSFSSIHAAASTQVHFVGLSYTYAMCIFGMGIVLLALAIIGYLVWTAKKKMKLDEEDGFMDKTDDLENDFGSMAFSVIFTMFVRFILTGHHPADDDTEFDHTSSQRTAMFVYAVVCTVVAGFIVSLCANKASEAAEKKKYGLKRVMTFVTTVAAMNVAWAWLYWGEWQFFETLYPGEAVKGRVMFAITMTMVGGFGLLGLSKIRGSPDNAKGSSSYKKVMLTALGLVIAWSWELCFDAAVEDMCEGVAHPVGWKVATTLMLAAIVVPVYGIYMKPITSKAAEAIGA